MGILYFLAIAIGFVLINYGFWATNEKKFPDDILGALMMFFGFILTFGGILLYCVPDFFKF